MRNSERERGACSKCGKVGPLGNKTLRLCITCAVYHWRTNNRDSYLKRLKEQRARNEAPDALNALTEAFNIEPITLAAYILDLRRVTKGLKPRARARCFSSFEKQ